MIVGHQEIDNNWCNLLLLNHKNKWFKFALFLKECIKDGVIQDEDVEGTLAVKDVAKRPAVMQPRKRDLKR